MEKLISISRSLDMFLSRRVKRGGLDVDIARKMQMHYLDTETGDDYLDAILSDGRAMISYLPASRRARLEAGGDPFAARGLRMSGRAGTVAQRIAGITDGRALAEFVEALTADLTQGHSSDKVMLYEGSHIVDVYDGDKMCRCNGGFYSCMVDAWYDKLALYVEHAEIAAVVCGDCGGFKARSIVWPGSDGIRWYDRVYADTTTTAKLLANALESRGVSQINPHANLTIWTESAYQQLPYLDTAQYCDMCGLVWVGNGHDDCQSSEDLYYRDEYYTARSDFFPTPTPIDEIPEQTVDKTRTHCECGVKFSRNNDEGCSGVVWCDVHNTFHCRYVERDDPTVAPCGCPICPCGQTNCERQQVCDVCGETWCRNNRTRCPNCRYCGRCNTSYQGERCPNEKSCPTCGTLMCRVCPNSIHCRSCGVNYCGERCPNAKTYCSVCDCWYHEETCWRCVKCDKCGTLTDTSFRPWEIDGMCSACENTLEAHWIGAGRYNPIAPGANGRVLGRSVGIQPW